MYEKIDGTRECVLKKWKAQILATERKMEIKNGVKVTREISNELEWMKESNNMNQEYNRHNFVKVMKITKTICERNEENKTFLWKEMKETKLSCGRKWRKQNLCMEEMKYRNNIWPWSEENKNLYGGY